MGGKQALLLAVCFVLPLCLSLWAWRLVTQKHEERTVAAFASLASENEKALFHRLSSYKEALRGAEGFITGSADVERAEWRKYVRALHMRANLPGARTLGYAVEVAPGETEAFTAAARQDEAPNFHIHPPVEGGPVIVVTHVEPPAGNALGLNIAFDEKRLEAALLSRDLAKPVITRRLLLVGGQGRTAGFLLVHPVYREELPLSTPAERQLAFRGWLYAAIDAQNLLHELTRSQDSTLNLEVYDGIGVDPETLIYTSAAEAGNDRSARYAVRKEMLVDQQIWTLVWSSTPIFEAAQRSIEGWVVLVAGLIATAGASIFAFSAARRTRLVEQLVVEKTRQIAAYAAELERSNRELDEFAYIASHDLKAPLRVIGNAARWLEEDLAAHLTGENRENMDLLRGRVMRMGKLLDDLLEYSRVGRGSDNHDGNWVNGQVLIDNILLLLSPPKGFELRVAPGFAGLSLKRMPLQTVLLNLIGNAIKHHDRSEGVIKVDVRDEGGFWRFTVRDDGPGIPKRFHEQAFKMFQTLRPRDQVEGSGMGLAFVKKTVGYFGGELSLVSEGRGTELSFTWPKQQKLMSFAQDQAA